MTIRSALSFNVTECFFRKIIWRINLKQSAPNHDFMSKSALNKVQKEASINLLDNSIYIKEVYQHKKISYA